MAFVDEADVRQGCEDTWRTAGEETKRMCVRQCTRRTDSAYRDPTTTTSTSTSPSTSEQCRGFVLGARGVHEDRELGGSQHSAVRALGGFEKENGPIERIRIGLTDEHAYTRIQNGVGRIYSSSSVGRDGS